jgi:hypothetical protein
LLPRIPEPDDVPAILAAARPLLDILSARGLLADAPANANANASVDPPA